MQVVSYTSSSTLWQKSDPNCDWVWVEVGETCLTPVDLPTKNNKKLPTLHITCTVGADSNDEGWNHFHCLNNVKVLILMITHLTCN